MADQRGSLGAKVSISVEKRQVLGAFRISLSPPLGITLINSSLVSLGWSEDS